MFGVTTTVLYLNTGGLYLIIDGAKFFDSFNGFPFSHLNISTRNNTLEMILKTKQASFYTPNSYL